MPDSTPSLRRLAYLRAKRREKAAVRSLQIFLLIFFLILWEISARQGWIDAFIVSSPSRVAKTVAGLYQSGDLWVHLWTSCAETAAGFLLGTLSGTLIAVLLWWSTFLSRVLDPYLVVLNALPKTALGPIFIVWIGAGTASIVAMVFLTIRMPSPPIPRFSAESVTSASSLSSGLKGVPLSRNCMEIRSGSCSTPQRTTASPSPER